MFRVVDGALKKGEKVRFLASSAEHDVTEVGVMQPNQVPVPILQAGEVGYLNGSSQVAKTNAGAVATGKGLIMVAAETVLTGNSGTWALWGKIAATGLTVGAPYYVSLVDGGITDTPPDATIGNCVRIIGHAWSATVLYFRPDQSFIEILPT